MKRLLQLLAFWACAAGLGAAISGWAAAAPADRSLNGDKVCTQCHDENWPKPILSIYQTRHGVKGDARTPGCQTCHGGSEGHVKASGGEKPDVVFVGKRKSDPEIIDKTCLTCHKGTNRVRWDGSQHQVNQVACTNCHNIHAPEQKVLNRKTQTEVCFACHKEQRADSLKLSAHPIQVGKVVCSDCHNPHGSAGPKLVKKNTLNETCYTCHADKRGPFLFEHQSVVEDCANCHTPHGSNITPLLKSRPPFLCQECHDGTHASGTPVGRNAAGNQGGFVSANPSANYTGRGCINCHSQVHGSNNPSGGYLQR